jgi:signal peptidase II
MDIKQLNPNQRVAILALAVFLVDQLTKWIVSISLAQESEWVVLHGFFKFVHLGNTGAALSFFHGNNGLLAVVGLIVFAALIASRHHFDIKSPGGQVALGLILGGIPGNLLDRFRVGHVVDFIYFYVIRRDGLEAGFPAFNVADTAICTGVGLLFLLSLRNDHPAPQPATNRSVAVDAKSREPSAPKTEPSPQNPAGLP